MSIKLEPLEPDHFYHIYNHAVSEDNLFRKQSDYFSSWKNSINMCYHFLMYMHTL